MNKRLINKKHIDSTELSVSGFTFFLYMFFVISFFLHLPSRIPATQALRPDLLLVVLISAMLMMEQNKLKGRLSNPCANILSIMMLYIFISLPFVEWPGSIINENFAHLFRVIVFFYFTVLIVDTPVRLRRFILVFIVCQLFRILEPLYLHVMFGYWGDKTYLSAGEFADRLSGAPHDVVNPNGLAFVIATIFPFIHYLWGTATWRLKILYFSLVPFLMYTLVLTMSRSGFIALGVVVWNVFIKSKRKILLLLVTIAACMMLWANMTTIQKDRYLSLTGDESVQGSASAHGRVDGMVANFTLALTRPIVGYGLGTSGEAIYNIRGGTVVSHTLYFEVMIEMGLLGFFIYMIFLKTIYSGLGSMRKNLVYIEDKIDIDVTYEKNLMSALYACFWMYIIFSVAQYGVSEYHWYLLAGIITALNRHIIINLNSGSVPE